MNTLMKFNKFFTVLGVAAAMTFTACTDEVDYTPAAAEITPGVYFAPDVEVNFEIDANSEAQVINLSRMQTEGDLTVNLTASGDVDLFVIPSSVTFANGSETAAISITPIVANMENFTTYTISIVVPDEVASNYAKNIWSASFTYANGSEWNSLGMCKFSDDLVGPLFSEPVYTWNVEIEEHTQTPGLYRLVNPYKAANSPYAKYCVLDENYVIVNATNPARVFFGDTPNSNWSTGVDLGYGVMTIGIQTYGSYADGKITWPAKGIAIFDNDGGYYANINGAFCIDLTGLK